MKGKMFLLAAGIIMVSILIYSWLGGFSSLEFELETMPAISISGEEFTGRPTQQELEELFYKYRNKALELDTSLIVVSYPVKDKTAAIRQFIGVPVVENDSSEVRTWQGGEYLKVVLSLNLIVTPKPEAVQEQAADFAKSLGRALTGESMEVYNREKDAVVYFPLAMP